ncbi:septal ring lytic transglycosylase RlpA family protein [Chamaesiphon minutus]|uniref:Probable endolytic peptidoglycan transglycosylase RlpA n=1 Tax=Chamaesiphon minutus (strain ATCC 27169 / PCC 6605) TaxID=1173020 RepID=K9UB63_CHAP6|nr:septal ring lytic transglycosylase RlpA family protein [Chamaesiphon minutus]AFY91858.1 rare lipoprotein A [Chamaesiphon minutus PCC 6605]
MNQHRWTCLTTLVLTAVIAPVANVCAKTLSAPSGESGENYSPLSPQSLPIITPLTVTELETETAVPAKIRVVPQVSKLPTVKSPSAKKSKISTRARQSDINKLISLPTKTLATEPVINQNSALAPLFNPNYRSTAAIFSSPDLSDSSTSRVNAVAPLPQVKWPTFKHQAVKSFTTRAVSEPIEVVRSDKSQPTVINNSIAAQADVADTPRARDSWEALNPVADDRTKVIPTPQVAPIVSTTDLVRSERLHQSQEIPSFEAGLPVFIFEKDHPKQIVATAIAQIDDTIVAPEPSIAIPVDRPKQAIVPIQSPSTAAPTPIIVKIEPPVVQPALEKIVSTQIGKASWYGSEAGSKTANGERYNPQGLTAAHRTLPFGTKVRVTNLTTGKAVIVRINDRGPFHRSRAIDISAGAAEVIGLKSQGVGRVKMEILESEG